MKPYFSVEIKLFVVHTLVEIIVIEKRFCIKSQSDLRFLTSEITLYFYKPICKFAYLNVLGIEQYM